MSTQVDASSDGMQVNTDNMYEVGEPFRFLPSARSLILAVGYAFVVASMFLVVVCGTVESAGWGDGHPDVHPARLLGAATVLITLFVGYLASDRFTAFGYRKTNLAGTAIAAVDLAVMAVVELLFGLYPIVEGVTSALFGFAVALVLISGGRLLREVPKNEILQTQASIYCMTGLLFIVAMLSTDVVKLFSCLVYVLLGCACYFVFVRGLGTAALPDRKTSVERLQFDWRSSFSYAITGLAIGIACVILWWTLGDDVASSVFGLGFIAASVVSVFISKVKGASWVLLGPVERWTFPFIVCVQLMIVATGFTSVVSIVLSVALYCVLMVRDISRAVTRQVLAAEYDVQSVYLYTRATLPVIGGIAVGVTVGTFLAVFEVQSYVTWVLYVLVALFSVAVAIVPYGQDKLVMPTATAHVETQEQESGDHGSEWEIASGRVCANYGLTPRESDVFGKLSRGRTAKVIARDLTISEHTVKSHTYNIYRKLGINSQQELIDIVVGTCEELEEESRGEKERLAVGK
ncbi:MAG: helix-turn-helix transcriptional regulator [Coriobacteriaceae bacterium]|nr:helix-turn-helix transcriptional regulator [Coriobacteriaceae bacterium]